MAAAAPAVPSDREVAAILASHHVSRDAARQLGIALWLRALHACIADDVVTDEELAYLNKVRLALNLRERDVDDLWYGETAKVYRAALADALADGEITDDEWRQVDLIASGMRLSKEARKRLGAEPLAMAIQREIDRALEDNRLSPAETEHVAMLAARTGDGNLTFSESQEHALARGQLLWRIENESLPVLPAPINLQKNEACHCVFSAVWHEVRTRTVRAYRSGPVASVRIMKGLSYRVGSYETHRVTADELVAIDSGTGYITNKRFIFNGAKKNTTIRYSSILALTPYSDGLAIEKTSGKSPILSIHGDAEIVTAIFAEALSRS